LGKHKGGKAISSDPPEGRRKKELGEITGKPDCRKIRGVGKASAGGKRGSRGGAAKGWGVVSKKYEKRYGRSHPVPAAKEILAVQTKPDPGR